MEQNNIGNSIEIKGISKTINVNCTDIVHDIAKKFNFNISLKSTYRIYSSDNNTNIIVAELVYFDMKKNFLSKTKSMNLNTIMIFTNCT